MPKKDLGGRLFPCGRMDGPAWEMMDPAFEGTPDQAVGDGRISGWQVVYYSLSRNGGMAVIVRPGHGNVCVADPLTATDVEQLRDVTAIEIKTDSTDAMTAILHRSTRIDRALSNSKDAQVSYGFDLREGKSWGIKGFTRDEKMSFSANVSLTTATVTDLKV